MSVNKYNSETKELELIAGKVSAPIDDSIPSTDKVYSSSKVESSLANYQYHTIKSTDANTCIPNLNCTKTYELSTTANNVPNSNYVWNIISTLNDRNTAYRLTQIAQGQNGKNTCMYIRVSASEDRTTWIWGTWQEVAMSSDVNWKVYTIPAENITSSASSSNLYCAYNKNTLCIKGWIVLKAGNYPTKTEIFNLGNFVAGINSYVTCYTQKNPSSIYNFWIGGNTNSVILDNSLSFTLESDTLLQFNTTIPLKV